jgi:GDP-4-dehydro-6-deoxy-D-mannose reductase
MTDSLRILVLGAGGFVGRYLVRHLAERFLSTANIVATSLHGSPGSKVRQLDVLDDAAVAALLEQFLPTHVVNLAGLAAPAAARANPDLAWTLNARVPESIGRLILRHAPECWFLHVGSGLVYGRTALSGAAMTELSLLQPMDPYGVTKAAGELALGACVEEGLKCLRLRPFNHTGPGQTEDFAIPALAAQLARIAASRQPPVISVGNLDSERDFLDVRDVVAAYGQLIEQSGSLRPGSIYNISSGRSLSIGDVLDRLIAVSGLNVTVERDPLRQRPSDIPRISGSSLKLQQDTGWSPQFGFDVTLYDIYQSFVGWPHGLLPVPWTPS